MSPETNEVVVTIAVFSIILLVVGFFVVVILLTFSRRKNSLLLEQQLLRENFEKQLLQTKLEIQEQTTNTISQELHDNIGQLLTLSKLHMNMIDWNNIPAAASKVEDSKAVLSKAIQELRDLSKTLNVDYITRIGLIDALRNELQNIQKASGINATLQFEDETLSLQPQVELIVFRIVQEALHNVIKHSTATHLTVTISRKEQLLLLQVKDNGSGFNTNDTSIIGSGLSNMKSRCKLINASFNMESRKDEGTIIFIELPLTESFP